MRPANNALATPSNIALTLSLEDAPPQKLELLLELLVGAAKLVALRRHLRERGLRAPESTGASSRSSDVLKSPMSTPRGRSRTVLAMCASWTSRPFLPRLRCVTKTAQLSPSTVSRASPSARGSTPS